MSVQSRAATLAGSVARSILFVLFELNTDHVLCRNATSSRMKRGSVKPALDCGFSALALGLNDLNGSGYVALSSTQPVDAHATLFQEQHKVTEIREKIKTFLASNGMIKGHSTNPARPGEDDAIILHFSDNDYSSSSLPSAKNSPKSALLGLASTVDDYKLHPLDNTSSVRDQASSSSWHQLPPINDPYNDHHSAHLLLSASAASSSVSVAAAGRSSHSHARHRLHPYSRHASPVSASSGSSMSSSSSSIYPHYNPYSLVPYPNPTQGSSFGALYAPFSIPEDLIEAPLLPSVDLHRRYSPFVPLDDLVAHYLRTVVKLQYLLADDMDLEIITRDIHSHMSLYADSARLLSFIHCERIYDPKAMALKNGTAKGRLEKLEEFLKNNEREINEDAAMASLNVISSFLFDGGKGDWESWLEIACIYVENLVKQYGDPMQALQRCTKRENFLVKTTIWFDTLASITTLRDPRLLHVIRQLYSPNASSMMDVDPDAAATSSYSHNLSMMTTMGCENIVVWAIAETSQLAAWKRTHGTEGSLSMTHLVEEGNRIEQYLRLSPSPVSSHTRTRGHLPQGEKEWSREYTAKIFKASAKVYLRSVVSGDFPALREIKDAVVETMNVYKEMNNVSEMFSPSPGVGVDVSGTSTSMSVGPGGAAIRDSIIQSTVFALFICGCLTDDTDKAQRGVIRNELVARGGLGNCSSIGEVLEEIWNAPRGEGEQVPWRQKLHDEKLLLV
jgi:C6 transcription factor Pro1